MKMVLVALSLLTFSPAFAQVMDLDSVAIYSLVSREVFDQKSKALADARGRFGHRGKVQFPPMITLKLGSEWVGSHAPERRASTAVRTSVPRIVSELEAQGRSIRAVNCSKVCQAREGDVFMTFGNIIPIDKTNIKVPVFITGYVVVDGEKKFWEESLDYYLANERNHWRVERVVTIRIT